MPPKPSRRGYEPHPVNREQPRPALGFPVTVLPQYLVDGDKFWLTNVLFRPRSAAGRLRPDCRLSGARDESSAAFSRSLPPSGWAGSARLALKSSVLARVIKLRVGQRPIYPA
jgi:hypothetical protein